jgi:hypothetical protein
MDLQNQILAMAKTTKTFGSAEVVSLIQGQLSRQYAARILKKLVDSGQLIKSGSTKNASYALPENSLQLEKVLDLNLVNTNLNEDQILSSTLLQLPGFNFLPENTKKMFKYSFSEIVNNAIEHSQSQSIQIEVSQNPKYLSFSVADSGIGIFANIIQKSGLTDEMAGVQDLLKGKTTTNASSHTGEGIFFTSKMADLFLIESHHLKLRIDNSLPDVFVEQIEKKYVGTKVLWQASLTTTRQIEEVFSQYQSVPETYSFDKTSVLVRLYAQDTEYLSRSQARRLLFGLEKFTSITLDFDQVTTIGQGFADEVFRVFSQNNPHISINYQNAIPPVEFMIKHSNSH